MAILFYINLGIYIKCFVLEKNINVFNITGLISSMEVN